MRPTDLVASLQSHLNSALPPPVKVDGSDNRPVPSILFRNWDMENIQKHNTRYVHSTFNDDGSEATRIYQIPYNLRVSFLARHEKAVDVSQLQDQLREELLKLENNPTKIADEVVRVNTQNGSAVDYQYANPTEAEASLSAVFTSAQTYERSDFDTIDSMTFDVEVVQN